MTNEIQKALKMAEAYARFAPGRLFRKDMQADGDSNYEATLFTAAMMRFLFPQFTFDTSEKEKHLLTNGLVNLFCVSTATRAEGAQAETITFHKKLWEQYKQSGLEKDMTPFQLDLINEYCSPEEENA